MEVLFWVVGFFVWYLVGLVSGLLVIDILEEGMDTSSLNVPAWAIMSSVGFPSWLLLYVTYRVAEWTE